MLQIGEVIFYGKQGVCEIVGFEERKLNGKKQLYYILRLVYNQGTTIYCPADSEITTVKFRPILSKEEILTLIHEMPDNDSTWIENEKVRNETYLEALTEGNHSLIVQAIKSLYKQGELKKSQGKKLLRQDEYMLQEAQRLLYEEFSFTLEIPVDKVESFIEKELSNTN